ncbi:DUF4276 family protein [Pseudomonas sp. IT-P44]|uniref:hypothetical protein n=1 Tax=Pseudomonas sp. IT-P44 TaxID=3026451 RepID=UPI0039E180B7
MSSFSNIHLLFCEGPHDAAFLALLLRRVIGFERRQLKISEIPYPFSNIFRQSMLTRSAEDLRLDLAKKFFLPDFLLTKGETLVMIFNSGGASRRSESIGPFLSDVFELLAVQSSFGGPDTNGASAKVRYAVFADADAIGSKLALDQIQKDLAIIGDKEWLKVEWAPFGETRAVTQSTTNGEVSAYIWRQWSQDIGTLEDLTLECLSESETILRTFEFLDQRFSWAPAKQAKPDQVCALAAKRLKAALCVEGQREKPGGSLSVILDQTNMLTSENLAKSKSVQDCVRFLDQWVAAN